MMREMSELSRRVANMILPGVIQEIDHQTALVRVESGEISTNWLPYFQRRAWNTIDWDPPEVGEPCLVLSPGGELAAGFVLTGLYSEEKPAPSKDPNLILRKFSDGLTYSYDLGTHTLTMAKESGLTLRIKADRFDFETAKASIKNEKGELISLLAEVLGVIATSKTPTLFGPQLSTDNAEKLPPIKTKLESFGG
ncbi:MAG TPA: phage baseplate assembly protein V [Oligoflexus sp.]|uniref:phage baseplate assembly protein V n=1 Tax=Oligoflexus sp. TaxID=1971216 RepID=UPI002D3174E2|nr:phage baseplate assembly protein V [Oligoflexus sp.]HYX38460.1 phage baseplate assembly protein V [Oligoflexus sp.]